MEQFLQRGCSVAADKRIRKMIAGGYGWQIYLTNTDAYVLAVKPFLYRRWALDFDLPVSVFEADSISGCKVFLSSDNYIISSLDKGPFPKNSGQIEAFSIAFRTAVSIFPECDFHDAVYIEEYSMILPTVSAGTPVDNGIVYGKWITGGVHLSIASFESVCSTMSWLPPEALSHCAQLAGFDVKVWPDKEKPRNEAMDKTAGPDAQETDRSLPRGRFTLVGRPALEQFFNDNIIDIVLHQEQYKRMGIPFPGATVLYGPPGCGKTFAVEKLAEYLGWQRFDIDSSTIASAYIHETSKKISAVFHAAIQAAPSVLVIDEMEAFLSDRSRSSLSGSHHVEEVAEFLRRIPEAISKGVLVFAMTNMLDAIDPAILRRGRFDHIIEVEMASADEIQALLASKCQELPMENSVDIGKIAAALAGRPMSDIAFVIREAGRFAVKRNLEQISGACFEDAIMQLPQKKAHRKIGF